MLIIGKLIVIQITLRLLHSFNKFKISHVLREGNTDADTRAHMAFSLQIGEVKCYDMAPKASQEVG